ncbi:MAG TPA: 16S rRNA (uracil(1498)-N(3))-methyltransferase [Pseudomonadales bacterium]|nr:16S rRNA (uracil(1498)-N(3))-methyltransferase [Pseudomonadales bacterium]
MNLVILHASELQNPARVTLSDRRAQHILSTHRVSEGDTLRVGQLNGLMGSGRVLAVSANSVTLDVTLDTAPPAAHDVILLLALPRPKMLKRIFQAITTLGIKQLYLINSYRVEKSFWDSPWLKPEAVEQQLILGLEQAKDTQLPRVELRKRFKPFIEDELPALAHQRQCWLPHPGSDTALPKSISPPAMIAIGPEGGFIPYEVDFLQKSGFTPVHMGERILRVDTAVTACLSRLL